jgi:hypothetical protein
VRLEKELCVQPTDMYHVGIVVPSLEDGQAHFADLFGVRWAPVIEAPTAMRTSDGTVATVNLRLVYSVDAPHLELIEAVPGSIWVLNPHSNIHHIGFWSDDLGGDLGATPRRRVPARGDGRQRRERAAVLELPQ